jgi:hypothetical protein
LERLVKLQKLTFGCTRWQRSKDVDEWGMEVTSKWLRFCSFLNVNREEVEARYTLQALGHLREYLRQEVHARISTKQMRSLMEATLRC